MNPNKCYCRIENGSNAYCFVEDCPIHGVNRKLEG